MDDDGTNVYIQCKYMLLNEEEVEMQQIAPQPILNSITVLYNNVDIYFEWNAQAHKAMTDRLLEDCLALLLRTPL